MIFYVHSDDVIYEELARCTDDFNGAQCKAVCVEAVSIIIHQKIFVSIFLQNSVPQQPTFFYFRDANQIEILSAKTRSEKHAKQNGCAKWPFCWVQRAILDTRFKIL